MAVGVRRSVETRSSYRSRPWSGSASVSTRRLGKRESRSAFGCQIALSAYCRGVGSWQGKEGCVRSTSALGPPPRSHFPHVWKVSTICRAQVPQGSGIFVCNRCLPPPVACRSCRAPVVRRPDPRPPPHRVVERPLQLCSWSERGPVGHETWTTRQTSLPAAYAHVPEAPSLVPLEAVRIAESS
jgi:hypothetical protein